jgi:hypothetical protein
MPDLAGAHTGLPWSVTFLQEAGDIRHISAEYLDWRVVNFFKALELLEERAPENTTAENYE